MISGMDVMIALKIAAQGTQPWGQVRIAKELGISQSSVHEALRKLSKSGLYMNQARRLNALIFEDFVVHATRFIFPGEFGGDVVGVPTAWSAAPLNEIIVSSQPIVWSCANGSVRGRSLEPLHKNLPEACLADANLHEWANLVEALRIGRVRDRLVAHDLLRKKLENYAQQWQGIPAKKSS